MSELKTLQNTKETTFELSGVHFAWVRLQNSTKKYESELNEYTITVIVDEDTADEYSDRYPKSSVKSIKTADFAEKFKFEAPYPNDKKQYIIKMNVTDSITVDKKTGEKGPIPYEYSMRPKAYLLSSRGVTDITMDKAVGNGSMGRVRFVEADTRFGTMPYMRAILVEDLVEVSSSGSGTDNPFADFGSLVESDIAEEDKTVESAEDFSDVVGEEQGSLDLDIDDDLSDVPF